MFWFWYDKLKTKHSSFVFYTHQESNAGNHLKNNVMLRFNSIRRELIMENFGILALKLKKSLGKIINRIPLGLLNINRAIVVFKGYFCAFVS